MEKYIYKNCPIPGGGFVTGFVFNPKHKNVLYARTDIGGVYRFDFDSQKWISLIDHVCGDQLSETYPLGIAVDEDNPSRLFIACGDGASGTLCISEDMGDTFKYRPIPCGIHGNHPGRGTGQRLVFANRKLYFASMTAGLLISDNMGKDWSIISDYSGKDWNVCPVCGEINCSAVWVDPRNGGKTVIVGTSGQVNASDERHRGHSLYISKDGGNSFEKLVQPDTYEDERPDFLGFVAQRIAFDGKYIYVTFNHTGHVGWAGMRSYSNDSGGSFDGRIFRYDIDESGNLNSVTDVTPKVKISDKNPERKAYGGYCGIEFSDGMLLASSIYADNAILASCDCGENWTYILRGLRAGKIDFSAVPYMKPEYNGGGSIVHWITDIKINPFDSDMAVFNTGTGIFVTNNLTALKSGETVCFKPLCDGLEETVHLNVYSPPSGDVKCLDICGDLGGFCFKDLDKPCENTFADEKNDRYITALNADFTEANPNIFIATPRGNWTGRTQGGVIISKNQGDDWKLLKYPYGLTEKIDGIIERIKRPNTDSGWVAFSADNKRIIWGMASRGFESDAVVYTDDEGESWKQSKFLDSDLKPLESTVTVRVYGDRTDKDVFYGFATERLSREQMREQRKIPKIYLFISLDKGETFVCHDLPELAIRNDNWHHSEVRLEPGKTGVIWACAGKDGLWKIIYDKNTDKITCEQITKPGDSSKGIGFGKKAENSEYNTLFTSGRFSGTYGFWRSTDYGKSWVLISNGRQHFGDIISISGDPRVFGRLYIATGSRGLFYGEPIEQ